MVRKPLAHSSPRTTTISAGPREEAGPKTHTDPGAGASRLLMWALLQFLHHAWMGEWTSLLERDSRRRMEWMLIKLTFRTSCIHQPEEALLPRANTLRLTLTLNHPLSRSFQLESKPSSQLAKAPKKTGSKEQVSKKTSRWPTGTLIIRKCRSKT